MAELVAGLREQVDVLRPGIEIHGRKCSEQMRPLHAHIETCFAKMETVTRELVAQAPGGAGGGPASGSGSGEDSGEDEEVGAA